MKISAGRTLRLAMGRGGIMSAVCCAALAVAGMFAAAGAAGQTVEAPSVSVVSLFSTPASDGTYQLGDTITARVDFDRQVKVTGTPQVNLTIGDHTRAAAYSRPQGPDVGALSLFFEYVVQAADADTDGLSIAADAIGLNGGGIDAAADGATDAVLSHDALAASTDHKVDGSLNETPTVSEVSFVESPAKGDTYYLGETIEVKVRFHRFVDVSGDPQLALTIGGQTQLAEHDYSRGTGGISDLHFKHVVQATDFDADGVSIAANAIRLNEATIKAASDATLNANLKHDAVADDATRKVDGVDAPGPVVTEVKFIGTPKDGAAYQSGETINAQVWFDRQVNVTGDPTLELTIGNSKRDAKLYTVRTETEGLGFQYTVQAQDADADGIGVAANAIRLNGGTITAIDDTTDAILTHAAVADDPSRKVGDGTAAPAPAGGAPAVSSVFFGSSPANGDTYTLGETIEVRVLFSERITVAGRPGIAIAVGDAIRSATYWGNYYGFTAGFRYTVQAADRDADGIAIAANSISLSGGSITATDDSADAALAHDAVEADSGRKVDGARVAAPAVSGVSISSRPRGGDTYVRGESIVVAVRFSEPVRVTGSPRLALTVGGVTRSAGFSRSDGSTLYFSYRVQADDRDADGIGVAGGALALNGGTIKDSDDHDAALGLGSHAIASAADHKVDASLQDSRAPEVAGVTAASTPQDGSAYVIGETIEVVVRFDEPVTVTGSPRLTLQVGGAARTAVYASSRLEVVRFHYVVEAGDNGALRVPADGLSLNGGTILDAAGNAAVLGLGSSATSLDARANGGRRDREPPTVRSVTFESSPANGATYELGDIVQVAVRFNEPVTVTGAPLLALAVGGDTRFASLFSAEREYLRFRYTVQEEDQDQDGIAVAAAGLSLNGGAIVDAAGNAANLSLAAVSAGAGDPMDGGVAQDTVPTRAAVTSEPRNGETYGRGESVDVEVRFNKGVTVSGQPLVELSIDPRPAAAARAGVRASAAAVTRRAAFVTAADERLQFRYVVQAGDASGGGTLSIAALRLNGGAITDASGKRLDENDLALTAAEVEHGGRVDGGLSEPAAARRVAVVSVPQADRTYRLGEHILVEVRFDKGVTVTGSPRLELTIDNRDDAARQARFVSSDHDTLRFRYDVQASDRDDDGIAIATGALRLNGGSIRGAGGAAAALGLERAEIVVATDKVDGSTTESTPPAVESVRIVSHPRAGGWRTGDRVSVEVRFSEPVVVTGRPALQLRVGGAARTAAMSTAKPAPETITFAYTLQANDRGGDGIGIPANALRLNGGTIRDGVGNDADLRTSEVLPGAAGAVPVAQFACKAPPTAGRAAHASLRLASGGGGGGLDSYDAAVTLELEEHRDGSGQAVELGCVALADPDRQYTYSITAGDRSRFAVGAADGALRYVGGGESAAQTPEYVLTVTATPRGGGTALTVEVRVAVVAVDDRGVVTLSTMAPLIGEPLTAELADRDGVAAGSVAWQWWRQGAGGAWSAIEGAAGAAYTPVPADGGFHLQARAGYRDAYGDQSAASARTEAVDLDPARRERMLQAGLAGFGRTVAATAVSVIGQRFSAALRAAGAPVHGDGEMDVHVTLNRRALALSDATDGEARAAAVRGVAEALGVRVLPDGEAVLAAPPAPHLLANSAFRVEHGAGGAHWGVWGAGDRSGFAADVDGFEQDATVLSGYVGFDYRFVPNALAGLAASYGRLDLTSTSEGDGDAGLEGALVSVYPYGLWMPEEWLGLWSLAGVGMGSLELTDAGGVRDGTIRTWLGAAGQRAELWSGGGLSVAAKSDGFVTGVTASGGLPGVSAHAWRARVLMEAGVELRSRDARLGGLIEVGGRLDGGDAGRGLGAEAGGELSYTHTGIGLGLTGRGRLLLVHEDAAVRDWGASLLLTLEPPDHGPGLTVSVAPAWGAPDTAAGALWRNGGVLLATDGGSPPAGAGPSWLPRATAVRVAYGLDLLNGAGRVAPFAEVGFEHAEARSLRAGATVQTLGAPAPYGLQIEAYGERRAADGQAPSLQFGLGGSLEY